MSFPTDWSSWGPADMGERRRAQHREVPTLPADRGTVIEETASGWVGAIVGVALIAYLVYALVHPDKF